MLSVYVRALASRPLIVAYALLVVGALFAPWTTLADGAFLVLFGAVDRPPDPALALAALILRSRATAS